MATPYFELFRTIPSITPDGQENGLTFSTSRGGGFLVSWSNTAKSYDTDGNLTGSFTGAFQGWSAALLANGDLVVIGARGQTVHRYAPNGTEIDSAVISGSDALGSVTVELANGNILATYSTAITGSGAVYGVILDSNLDVVEPAFEINPNAFGGLQQIRALAGGGFVVLNALGNGARSVQAFDASGQPVGAEIAGAYDVEAFASGGFVVLLPRTQPYAQPVQIFNDDGSPRTAAFEGAGGILDAKLVTGDGDLVMLSYLRDPWFVQSFGAAWIHADGHLVGNPFTSSPGSVFTPQAVIGDTLIESQDRGNYDFGLKFSEITPIFGTDGADTLDGRGIDLRLIGSLGDDTYLVDGAGARVDELAGQGNDRVLTSVSYQLPSDASVELLATSDETGTAPLALYGNTLQQEIRGNAGNNVLVGVAGNGGDILYGLGGDDLLFVGSAADQVREAAGGGNDRVYASVNYTLTAGQEIERLTTDNNNSAAPINLTGNERNDLIYGNAGNNRLDGAGGADQLVGLAGNDVYVVDQVGDRVYEAANEGVDTVLAAADFGLGAGQSVEILQALVTAGTTPLYLAGNALPQTIIGNAGANILVSNGGGDLLMGAQGDDWYYVSPGDVVNESGSVPNGFDRVYTSGSWRLSEGAGDIELVSALDLASTAAINIYGNSRSQAIYGNAGDNVLDDGGGAGDFLTGLGGNDSYNVRVTGTMIDERAGGGIDRVYAAVGYVLADGVDIELLLTIDSTATTAINLVGNELAQDLYGNAGANTLNGGLGRDELLGLGGADRYLFDSALNTAFGGSFGSLATSANVDRINGFDFDDKILLSGARFGLTPGALAAGAFALGSTATEADDRILYDTASQALLFDADGAGGEAARLFAFISNPFSLDATYFAVV